MKAKSVQALAFVILLSLVVACDRSNDHPPLPTTNHNCLLDRALPPPGEGPFPANLCVVPPAAIIGCTCLDYAGMYPPDTYDSTKAKCLGSMPDGGTCNQPNRPAGEQACTTIECCDQRCAEGRVVTQACPNDFNCEGCSNVTHFAWPDCAQTAEVSGKAMKVTTNFGDDDDFGIDVCPLTDRSMRRAPFNDFTEIRGTGSYSIPFDFLLGNGPEGNEELGRIHVEAQDCRLYDGVYTLSAGRGVPAQSLAARPENGELVSASGDWIVDDNMGFLHSLHTSWAEIHEESLLAVTRPVVDDESILYSTVTSFFSVNRPEINVLDVKIPPPTAENMRRAARGQRPLDRLQCEFDFTNQVTQSPECGRQDGVVLDSTQAFSNDGVCRIRIRHRNPAASPPIAYGCQKTCDHKSFSQRFPTDGCKNVFFAGVLRSQWTDPADLWICNCPCQDPSAPNAFITAPIQGCAPAGLGPSQQQEACAAVCGGVFCGASESCSVRECQAPQSGGTAHLVAQGVCDPDQPPPPIRVATAGDYRVVLDDSASTVTFHVEDTSSTQPAAGTFYLNAQKDPTGGILEFASAQSTVPDEFTVKDQSVKDATIVIAERMFAQLSPDQTTFRITAGDGVFAVRGFVNGDLKGQNVRNPQAIGGSVQLEKNGRFVMDIHAEDTDPDSHGDRLDAHLEGIIDNVPPVAVSGGPKRTVECVRNAAGQTTVVLDGSASFDPDAGDSISHYQWFTALSQGVANQAVATVSLPLGTAQYVLHVYDQKLGAADAPLDVTVADTTPPALSLSPTSFCMWPPNHRRVRFALSDLHPQTSDACDPAPNVRIVSVTSNEADNGLGDGDIRGDVAFSAGAFCVRRERSGTGTGRTYTVTVESRDQSGNTTRRQATVTIPHDQSASCSTLKGTEIADDSVCQ